MDQTQSLNKGGRLAEKFALQKRDIREKSAGLTSLLTSCGQISEDQMYRKQEQSVACSELYQSLNPYIWLCFPTDNSHQYQ